MVFSSHMTAIRVFFMVFETKWSNWKIDVCAAGAIEEFSGERPLLHWLFTEHP